VLGLRAEGFEIHTASINPPDRAEAAMTDEERSEYKSTFCLKRTPIPAILAAVCSSFLAAPSGWFRGLFRAVRLGGTEPRQLALYLAYFVEALMVGRWMQRLSLNHLHVHFGTPAASVGMLAARTFGFGLSLTIHGPDEFYDVSPNRLPDKIEAASFICCIGRYCRSQLMKISAPRNWNKFEIAPLGVNPDDFPPRPEPSGGTFQLLCVGRLAPAKGQMILLQAMERLIAGGRRVRLSLAGDGPDRAELEKFTQANQLQDYVVFHGAVNQTQVRALFREANAFVLPSFAEGIPVALMEAMSMEVPVISTQITGIPELIESGKDGILVMPSDVEALAEAIAKLMDDPAFRQSIAAEGRRKVLRDYNLPVNIKRLARIFERRLGK
jgi:glycosyltransferase involved in cell wall biosynthesis